MVPKNLLLLDTAFSLQAIKARGLERSITCTDLNGYFEHVWTVHPFASLVSAPDWGSTHGRPSTYELTNRHTYIEGKIGISRLLRHLPTINFLFSQVDIFFHLLRLCRSEKISIIRAGDPLYLGMFGWVLSKITRIPLVIRVGANNEKIREATGKAIMPRLFKSKSRERFIEHFVLSRADLIAGASPDNLKFAIDSGAPVEKCTLFRYGNLIAPVHFTSPSERGMPTEMPKTKYTLLCIARLEAVKRVEDVIRVLSEVRRRGYDASAILAGDGSQLDYLKKLSNQLDVQSYVSFVGNKDQDWLATMIPSVTVVLSPHTGRALAEAALGAASIVAYDVDWQPEIIQTGKTGILVDFGDWQELANATINLLSDHKYAEEIGTNVREMILEMMDPEKLNQHESQQYDVIINKAVQNN